MSSFLLLLLVVVCLLLSLNNVSAQLQTTTTKNKQQQMQTTQVCGSSGNVCFKSETCVPTPPPHTGMMYACSPHINATICSDSRYSCPHSLSCDLEAHVCVNEFGQQPMSENGRAVIQQQQQPYLEKKQQQQQQTVCHLLLFTMPSYCTCTESGANNGAVFTCTVTVDVFNVVTKMDLEPCMTPLHIDIEVVQGVDFKIPSLEIGTNEFFPIPGFSINIPYIGTNDVGVSADIQGSIDALYLKIGLDAQIVGMTEEEEDLDSLHVNVLPMWFLDQTFDFSSVCV